MIGELPVGMPVVQKAERVLESLPVRLPRRRRAAQAPFADDRRAVSGVLKRHRNGDVFRTKGKLAVAANPGVAGVQPRHQGGPRGRADGAAGVVLSKTRAFTRQSIQMRSLEAGLTVRAEIAVAEIVGLDEQDVRRAGLRRLGRGPHRLAGDRDGEKCGDARREPRLEPNRGGP